jgi:hypothetical protein
MYKKSPRTGTQNQLRGGLSDLLGLSAPSGDETICPKEGQIAEPDEEGDGLGTSEESPHNSHSAKEYLDSDKSEWELIGRGAFGCVYKGFFDGQPAAIKVRADRMKVQVRSRE